MIFFDILINKKNPESAGRYLENNLFKTLSKIYGLEWKSKEKYFQQKIKNSEEINWKKLMNLNYKKLNNFLKKFFGIIENDDYNFLESINEDGNKINTKKFFSQEGKINNKYYKLNFYFSKINLFKFR